MMVALLLLAQSQVPVNPGLQREWVSFHLSGAEAKDRMWLTLRPNGTFLMRFRFTKPAKVGSFRGDYRDGALPAT